MKLIWVAFIVLVTAGVLGACSRQAATVNEEVLPADQSEPSLQDLLPSPSPILFEELTIPYLRNRTYNSSVAELQRVGETSTYTSYLTSYDSDGLRINALLTQPKGQAPEGGWPAVVFIHGYIPPTQYRTQGPQYADYVDYIARNGIAVFKIDLRGHGSSEGEPGGAYYSSDYIVDALNARAALQGVDFVNGGQIGLWGHSMAGNVVFRALAVQPEIPAAVIWAGAVYSYDDLSQFGIDDNSYQPPPNDSERQQRRRQLFEAHGEFNSESPFWQLVTPTNYAADLKSAIQIHHAVNDDVVNIGFSRNLMSILDGTPVIHELYEYPSGGHNISGSSFTQAMQRTVDFYKAQLVR